MKDRYGDRAAVRIRSPECHVRRKRVRVVVIRAEGVWFTPAQARRFAKQILSCADRLDARKGDK